MTRIDLDDLPPRLARILAGLRAGDELVLVQGGAVHSRLSLATVEAAHPSPDAEPEVDAEAHMEEVLEHFKMMIEDEF